ncbi:Uncharacterised protein [uncultured archaeon]|nr:Uncharacterised protein [uncultured archaeon]
MRKAFIAAPLIGTTIFLVAIFFAVNLSKTESSAVSEIANNAYHSRLISLMELYRSDLKSVFKIGISSLVENQIAKQCWNYPLTIQYSINSTGGQDSGPLQANGLGFFANNYQFSDEVERRLDFCYRLKKVVGGLTQASGNGTSIKNWLTSLNNSIVFEGIAFNIASQSKFSEFKDKLNSYPGWNPPANHPECVTTSTFGSNSAPNCDNVIQNKCTDPLTIAACSNGTEVQQLLGNGLFDCFSFAEMADPVSPTTQYSCCTPLGAKKQDDYYNQIQNGATWDRSQLRTLSCNAGSQNYLAGCEGGQFYYQLNVKSPDVYPLLPRIEASDGKGNIIRSGGIADENEYLLIRYPFFKYYDLSLKFGRALAFGKNDLGNKFIDYNQTPISSSDINFFNNGYLSGLCVASGTGPANCPIEFHNVLSAPNDAAAQNLIIKDLTTLAVNSKNTASNGVDSSKITFNLNRDGFGFPEYAINDTTDFSPVFTGIVSSLSTTIPGNPPTTSNIFFSSTFDPYLILDDTTPGVQINPDAPNHFCIALRLVVDQTMRTS